MKFLPRNFIGRFICLVLLWLPVWLVIWYFVAGFLAAPAVWLAGLGLNVFYDDLIKDFHRAGNLYTLVTSLTVAVPGAPEGRVGEVVVEQNPLIYCWNLPVLLALLFAADERFFSMGRMFGTYFALLPVQAWGIGFDVLKNLLFQSGPEVTSQFDLTELQINLVGLGYQFGYLILPLIAASGIWVVMNRDQLEMLRNSDKEL